MYMYISLYEIQHEVYVFFSCIFKVSRMFSLHCSNDFMKYANISRHCQNMIIAGTKCNKRSLIQADVIWYIVYIYCTIEWITTLYSSIVGATPLFNQKRHRQIYYEETKMELSKVNKSKIISRAGTIILKFTILFR